MTISVKSLQKQLIAAIAMMLVATIALGSSTYAWFAINSKVTATGMSFTTTVQDNLFIATAAHSDIFIKPEEKFKTTEVQTVSGVLEPVSTKDGKSFWYSETNNVNGDGQVQNNVWKNYGTEGLASVPKPNSDPVTNFNNNAFSLNYIPADTTNAVGFVDYVYDIKAVAGGATTLNLTKLDLTYADTQAAAVNSAFRVAVFVEKANGTGENTATGDTGDKYSVTAAKDNTAKVSSADVAASTTWIFAPAGKETNNFTTNSVTNAVVTGASTVAEMTYQAADATINITDAGTYYYKVVVRVWLEGQDKNCNNSTFAKLDDGTWGLTTEWTLGDATGTPVTAINVVESLKSTINLATDSASENTTVINGVTYYQLTTNTNYYVMGTGPSNATKPTTLKDQRIFTIVDGQITEVTHIVTLPTT